MKRIPSIAGHNDVMLLWLACIAALCAGYYVAFGLLGAAIDYQHLRSEEIQALARADAQTIAQRSDLEGEERRLSARLNRLDLRADKPTTVARFIHTAAALSAANHVSVVAIDERPGTEAAAPPTTTNVPLVDAFEPIPLDVTLSGSYRDLIATIRALNAAPVTLQIEIAAIERASTPAAPLCAHLHVVLERLVDAVVKPPASLSSTEESPTHARSF